MKFPLFISLALLLLASCTGAKEKIADTAAAEADAAVYPIPAVPENLTDPAERADYIARHYWDNFNFADTVRSHDRAYVEQAFVNYISVLPYASSDDVVTDGFSILMKKASVDTEAHKIMRETAEDYLYDPNSPMLSEDLYILYLNSILKNPGISEEESARTVDRIETVSKNRPGTSAADFNFTTTKGEATTLKKYLTGIKSDLMLIFFDPDCENCDTILNEIKGRQDIKDGIASGSLSVLAVYTGSKKELWQKKAALLPSSWTIGINNGEIEDAELYYLPAMPTVYILDSNGTVKAKDVRL